MSSNPLEIWDNFRQVYNISDGRKMGEDIRAWGRDGWQIVSVLVVQTLNGAQMYEVYLKKRIQ